MDFDQAYQAYVSRCQQFQARQISASEFTAWLDRLRVQDAQGQWWQIEHPSGEWLCWNGQAWERRHPPGQATPPTLPPQEPQSLVQLLGWLTRSVLKTIPHQLILGIMVSSIIWLLHTVLVVGLNEGFNASGNPWFNSILVLPSQIISGTLFWVFTGIFVSQLIHGTLGKHLTAIATLPKTLVRFYQQSSQFKAPILWLGLAGTLVLSIFFGNLLVSLQAMVFALVALQESHHILRLVLKLGWHDVQKLRSGSQAQLPLTPGQTQQLLLGIVMGCSVAALLFWLFPTFLQLTAIVAIALTLFQFFAGNRPTPSSLSLLILFLLGGLILGYSDPAWADDGGWQEAGGRIDLWIQSPGALTAVVLGFPASLGSWLGWILGGLQSPSVPVPTPGTLPENIEYTYPDGRHTTLVYDPEKGGYINILTGGWVDPNEITAWHQNNLDTYQRTEDWRRRNEELERTGQDAQSLALRKIAEKYEQERIRNSQETQQAKQELRKLFEDLQKSNYRDLQTYENQAKLLDRITRGLEWIKWGCDKSIDVLEKVTGSAGKVIRNSYTVLSGTAEGLGEGLAHGDIISRTAKGTARGFVDLGARKFIEQPLTKWLGDTRRIPGFRDLRPGSNSMGFMQYGGKVDFGKVLVSKVSDTFRGSNTIDRFLAGHIQSQINHSLVNAGMRELRNQTVYKPLKWGKDSLKRIIGS